MDGEAHIRKAYESILQSDFEQAVASFEQAILLDPQNAEYHYKLSITFQRNNRLFKALEHAKTAVQLEPGHEAYRQLVRLLEAKELLAQAEACFEGGIDQLYMAVFLLQQSIKLDGLSVEAHLLLGLAYSGLKEYGPAVQAVKEALRLDHGHEPAAQLLQILELKLNQYMHSTSNN